MPSPDAAQTVLSGRHLRTRETSDSRETPPFSAVRRTGAFSMGLSLAGQSFETDFTFSWRRSFSGLPHPRLGPISVRRRLVRVRLRYRPLMSTGSYPYCGVT